MADNTQITVTETRKLLKFDVGVDPTTGTPYEISEQTIVHTGQDAVNYLNQLAAEFDASVNTIQGGSN